MSKIVFAYQSWNNDFDYFNPNTHPSDSVINGVKTVPYTHGGQYFTWESVNYDYSVVYRKSYEELIDMGVKAIRNDYLQGLVEHRLLSSIPEGQKYIYPVSVHQVSYFKYNRHHGFDFIDARVINDVKNNRAKIVIMFPYEGNTGIVDGSQVNKGCLYVDEWCSRIGFSKNQVYFIHGNILADNFNNHVTNYTSQSIDAFTTWLPRDFMANHNHKQPEYRPVDNKNLYLCYNRTIRPHRKFLLANLYKNNLIDRGIISFGQKLNSDAIRHEFVVEKQFHYEDICQGLSDITPIEIDMDLRTNNPAIDIQPDHYEKTFISVMPETHYEDGILFRSEKIWKTLAVGHPFMVISCAGFLESLKELGYKTYGKWINESYDAEPNWLRRIHLITQEIKRLSSLSIDNLKAMREEMKEDVQYNMDLLRSHYKRDMEHDGSGPLYRRVEAIWNSF